MGFLMTYTNILKARFQAIVLQILIPLSLVQLLLTSDFLADLQSNFPHEYFRQHYPSGNASM